MPRPTPRPAPAAPTQAPQFVYGADDVHSVAEAPLTPAQARERALSLAEDIVADLGRLEGLLEQGYVPGALHFDHVRGTIDSAVVLRDIIEDLGGSYTFERRTE